MHTLPLQPKSFPASLRIGMTGFALVVLVITSGCQKDVVYQRSMSELNQKAQAMMQAGDYDGAVSRLEAAHDLQPDEVATTHNLAVAYQMQGNYDKAIETFSSLLDKPGMDVAEIQKALGIAYEARSDKLAAEATALEEKPGSDKAEIERLRQTSQESLHMALEQYRKAVGGLKTPGDVQKQIEALQAKLEKEGASPSQ